MSSPTRQPSASAATPSHHRLAAASSPSSLTEERLADHQRQQREDSKTLRRAVAVAIALHLALLAITFPSITAATPEAADRPKVHVVEVVRFKQPEPIKTEVVPQKRTRKEPMPDPTPHDPEPIRDFEPAEFVEIATDDLSFEIPSDVPEPDNTPQLVVGDVQKPEKLKVVPPRYTEIARRARIQGTVIVASTIDEAGNVVDVSILKGLPMGLSESAMDAVRQWKFKPATLHGKPVAVYFNLTVAFELQ